MSGSGTTLVESIVASVNNTISGKTSIAYELFKSRYDEDDSDSKDSKDQVQLS